MALSVMARTGAVGKLVDDLGFDKGGVHIEAYKSAAAAEDVVFLKGYVELFGLRHFHEAASHTGDVDGVAADGELYACLCAGFFVFAQRRTAGEALYAVDV